MMEIGRMMSIGSLNMDLIQMLKDGPTLFMILIKEKEIISPKNSDFQINNTLSEATSAN